MNLYIKLANKIIYIVINYTKNKSIFENYIAIPQVPDFKVIINKNVLIEEKLKAHYITETHERFSYNFSISELEYSSLFRKIVIELYPYNIIMLHGVLLCVGDSGYIITAKSGVGKTTRALKWLSNIEESFIVNGDKPLLEIKDNSVIGYGTPWCGKEGYNVNTSVKVKGICLLSRSEENSIEEISLSSAFSRLINQVYIPNNETVKMINLLKKMSNSVKFYELKCDTSDEAALMAYNYIKSCERE